MGRVRAWIKSCWVGWHRERVRDVIIATTGIPKIQDSRNSGIPDTIPTKIDENWVRYGLAKLGQISRTKLAEDAVLCVHNTASALNR